MAAATLGANSAQAFWQVFCQLSMRGVAAAGLLVLVASFGFFITPALVGGPRDTMIGQLIILQINELQNWQLGSALATILLISVIATCIAYDRIFGLSSVSGGSEGRARPDGYVRRAGLAAVRFAGLVFGVVEELWKRNMRGLRGGVLLSVFAWTVIAALLVPIVAFVPMAFTASTFLSFPPQSFSVRWFEEFAASPLWLGAMVRSFGIGFATAAITVVIGSLAALGVARTHSRFGGAAFLVPGPDDDSVDRDRDRPVLPVCQDVPGGDGSRYHHRAQRHRHADRVRGAVGDFQGTRLEFWMRPRRRLGQAECRRSGW